MIVLEEKKAQLAQKPDDVMEATDAASVAQGVVDDHADIQNAQAENREQLSNKSKSLFRIGPGLITGVADDDPSGIGTYSVAHLFTWATYLTGGSLTGVARKASLPVSLLPLLPTIYSNAAWPTQLHVTGARKLSLLTLVWLARPPRIVFINRPALQTMEHCQQCSKDCHKCAEECRKIAKK